MDYSFEKDLEEAINNAFENGNEEEIEKALEEALKAGIKKGLKKARKAQKPKITQDSLAEKINISLKTVMNWEQGRNIPSLEKLFRISILFDHCSLDYLIGKIDCSTHDSQFIHEKTGLSEKAIKMLDMINKEAKALNYGSYSFRDKEKHNIIGAEKTLRVINELLENEYDRFIENEKTGFMDNLFTAIDEYMHPADFEFCVFDKKKKETISGQHIPQILDKSIGVIDPIPEEEIYRNIIMDRIHKMLMNLKYDMESATVAENIKKKGRKNNENK